MSVFPNPHTSDQGGTKTQRIHSCTTIEIAKGDYMGDVCVCVCVYVHNVYVFVCVCTHVKYVN